MQSIEQGVQHTELSTLQPAIDCETTNLNYAENELKLIPFGPGFEPQTLKLPSARATN